MLFLSKSFTVWLETMVFTGNQTLTVTSFGKRLCLGNNPSFQHSLVERFLKKGLIIRSCIEWIAMLWGSKSLLTCLGDLKTKTERFDVRAICVSLNRQFPVGISIPLFFYFTMSASSWPRCTLCQGEVKTSCILWCEIKYCCASVESWSLFFPPRSHVSGRVYMQETGLGSYLICFEGLCICLWHDSWCVLLNCFCLWRLHKVHHWTEDELSESPALGIFILTSKWGFVFCVDLEHSKIRPN